MVLTELEAYNSMVTFLEDYYNITHSDEIGGLLGSMMMLEDGTTADPAIWHEWMDAIHRGKNEVKKLILYDKNEA